MAFGVDGAEQGTLKLAHARDQRAAIVSRAVAEPLWRALAFWQPQVPRPSLLPALPASPRGSPHAVHRGSATKSLSRSTSCLTTWLSHGGVPSWG